MALVVTIALCGSLLLLVLYRMCNVPPNASPSWWAFTQVAALIALAKLARTPEIADSFGETVLYALTGQHNLMTLVGMTLGALVSVPAVVFMLSLTGYQPSWRRGLLAELAIIVAMVATFLWSPIPRSGPTSYITDGIPQPWSMSTWAYWSIFLGVIATAAVVNLVLALNALTIVPLTGPFGLTLLGWAATAASAALYIGNKMLNLIVENASDDNTRNWYLEHAPSISLALVLLIVVSAGATLLVYPVNQLPRRYRRYRTLRRSAAQWERARHSNPQFALPGVAIPSSNRLHLWRAAKDPLTAYNLQVELSDIADATRV